MAKKQVTEDNIKALKEQMRSLGFPERLDEAFHYYNQHPNFSVPYVTEIRNNTLYCDLHFRTKGGTCNLTSYDATLREEIIIPEINAEGINTRDLDSTLKTIDGWYNDALGSDFEKKQPEEISHINETIQSAHAQLLKLISLKGQTKDVAQLLMFKYWSEIDYKKFFKNYQEMADRFETKCSVPVHDHFSLSVEETYSHLKDIADKRFMGNEHVISDEALKEIQIAITNQEHWLAYNKSYFLEAHDVYSFKTKKEAEEFAENNISDHDSFKGIPALSVDEVLKQIPYGQILDGYIANPDANGLYNHDGNAFTDALIVHIEQQQILNNKNQIFMNEQNLKYLKENIKYLGFGEKLFPELQNNIEQGLSEFHLKISTEFNKDKIGAELHFKKSETNDMYFLNGYNATLQKPDGRELSQAFYLNKGNGITIKEAYNLLHGRAVNKDLTNKQGEKFNTWIQLDLTQKNEKGNYESKQYHKNYGYDLELPLLKFPIKELENKEQKEALMKSLQKGNLQSVTFEHNGKEQKMFIAANPQMKTINIYDTNMKLQQHDSLKKNEGGQQLSNSQEKQNVEQKKEDKSIEKKQEVDQSNKKGKVVKMNSGDSLLPKKRTSASKGLHP